MSQFASENARLSVGLVFDTSGSMGSKLEKSRQAAGQFFKTTNPEDEFFLVQFNDRARMIIPFTHRLEEILNQERDGKYRRVQVKLVEPRGAQGVLENGLLCSEPIKQSFS